MTEPDRSARRSTAVPIRPELLAALLTQLREAPVTAVTTAGPAPLVTRIAHPAFRRPVPAPALRVVEGARAGRPLLVPSDLAAFARVRRTADPTPDAI